MAEMMRGLVAAEVIDVDDHEALGRVKLSYLDFGADAESVWAPIAATMAGDEAGVFFMPDVGDIAVLGFLKGGLNQPVVLGFLWNGDQAPPAQELEDRKIVSRKGHSMTFFDSNGDDGITLEDAHGNKIAMSKDGVSIETKGKLTIKSTDASTIECAGELTVKGATIKLNP